MSKLLAYSFGIIGILVGLSLIYCTITNQLTNDIFVIGSIEFFASTSIFLVLIKQFNL